MVTVEGLYTYWEILDAAKDELSQHEGEFVKILEAVNAGPSEKKLASQLVARFFKHFPKLSEQALNAMFDLCEDDDSTIRKHAIRDLPRLCKDRPEFTSRIADVLTQLFQTDDSDQSEILLLHTALLSVFRSDFKGAVSGVFTQIEGDENIVRERAINFLAKKLSTLPEELFTKENEECLLARSREVLKDVSGDEFLSFMKILSRLKICQTVQGRQLLAEISFDQLECGLEFKASDPDCFDRLRQCVNQALPFFSKNVPSTRFIEYICDNVLPVMTAMTATAEDNEESDIEFELLKILAELSPLCGDLDEGLDRLGLIYEKLLEYMPLPPASENGDNKDGAVEQPQLLFSHVECLLIAFHHIGPKFPEFLTDNDNAERLRDFKKRLQYFAHGSQAYFKQLKASLSSKTAADAPKTEEDKIKVVALKVTMNINALVRDLMHNPPSYKTTIIPSWKPTQKPVTADVAAAAKKRPSTESTPQDKKSPRNERVLYAPPSGKYSEKAGTFNPGDGGRGRGRFRGRGFRGGGRGRGSQGVRF